MNGSLPIDTGSPLSYVSRRWRQACNFLGVIPKTILGNWNGTLDNHLESLRAEWLLYLTLVIHIIKYAKSNPNGGICIIR